MIELININKDYIYRDQTISVLHDINIKIEKGESVCIRGESGTGKTTLLNIIGGILTPTSGVVKVNGTNLTELPQRFLSQYRLKNIGFIFQQFNLLHDFTVMENLLFPLIPLGIPFNDKKEKIFNLLNKLHIGHRAEFYINYLSGGEQQRVAIARALVNDPEIIIADEPFSNLDPKNTKFIIEIFHEYKSRGKTIVASSVSLPNDMEKELFTRDIKK